MNEVVFSQMRMKLVCIRRLVGVQSYSKYYMWMTYELLEVMSQCYNLSIYWLSKIFFLKDLGEATYHWGHRSIKIDREGCLVF